MSSPDSQTRRLIALVSDIQIDGPTPERLQALRELLSESESLRRLYLHLINLDTLLNKVHQPIEMPDAPESLNSGDSTAFFAALEELGHGSDQAHLVELANRAAPRLAADGHRSSVGEQAPGPRVMVIPWAVVWASAAAVALLLVWAGWLAIGQTHSEPGKRPIAEQRAQPQPPASAPPRDDEHGPPPPVRVGRVVAALDAAWADGSPAKTGQVIVNRKAVLSRGIVQLRMDNGVRVTLEAPCAFEPASPDRLTLTRGKLVGRVPATAVGFTVHAPGVDVVDLSTEFAVQVDAFAGKDGQPVAVGAEVLVLDGQVMLRSSAQAKQGFAQAILGVGDARRIDARGQSLAVVDAVPSRFYREVPDAYERALRGLSPASYWRFEQDGQRTYLDNLGSSGSAVRHEGESLRAAPGIVGAAMRFDGSGRIEQHDAVGGLFSEPFTIEAWVWIDDHGPDRQRIVSNGSRDQDQQMTSGIGFGVTRANASQNYLPMLTAFGIADYVGDRPLATRAWTHLAVSVDDLGRPRFYVNGEPVQTRVLSVNNGNRLPAVPHASAMPLWIGDTLTWMDSAPEHWHGRLDELAIHNRALTPQELARELPSTPGGTPGTTDPGDAGR